MKSIIFFKILENQDDSIKKKAGFGIQNPISLKLSETQEGNNNIFNKSPLNFSQNSKRTEYFGSD